MERLISYLLENLMLDIQGDLSLEQLRELLREDNNETARALLGKLTAENGVSDMMIVLADCLQEYISKGITRDVVAEQLRLYSES